MLGFSWGYSLQNKQEPQQQVMMAERKQDNITTIPTRHKRQHDNDNDMDSSIPRSAITASSTGGNNMLLRKYMVAKKKPNSMAHTSTVSASAMAAATAATSTAAMLTLGNTPNYIAMIEGQPLPLERSLDLMDKSQLQNVIMDLLHVHPQVSQHLQSSLSQYSFSNDRRLVSLREKFQDIYSTIPYNKDYMSNNIPRLDDYAFVRLKPLLLEFLNCLTDYILNNIPPRSSNLQESLLFLGSCTQMVCELPRFTLPSNNYYYDKCLEQLSYIWCTLIQHLAQEDDTLNGMWVGGNSKDAIINNLYDKLNQYNETANNLLARPLQLLKHIMNTHSDKSTSQHENNNNNSGLNNILTTDHKNTF
ncbi:similar to Saccharomyces cerevisiae YIR011C STS1 Protein required for localizing proteasomes to the nucleus [Maudiozyma barnettii]|uniref:Tethering factor for nuclear proteasome STS1 n=1 Tax=Maudiozyma barnettii TaxID=61262 RepID=A0A8H2VF82_9SACH|nr:Sts1p [Kazachstania barnettii]CAB4254054.1 similar to Saccharomyces cerevisiae YIR011C STS1 Protein required for localizing proteasomes to the nucleus [Kazachstania barnettii]CAD1781804.1 similar to Saccharomyces cerevisiae YIR011C STS1 Protein required for localizing proteasomes to the nucleus [Kazachstania barnettii]